MKQNNRITLQDIANTLNFTKVTVSKALRDHPDISRETKDLIKETAQKMGYYPNLAARNLTTKKTNTIGVIVPFIASTYFTEIIDNIYGQAYKSNYEIILAVSLEDTNKERQNLENMLSMQVDGILISITEHSKNFDLFKKIKDMNVPLVFFDRIAEMENINSVSLDNEKGSFKATQHAIKSGYRSIGFLGGWDDINIGRDRRKGFRKALVKNNIEINEKYIIQCGYSKKEGYAAFMEMHKSGNIPDFLLTVTFQVALGVYDAAQELGLKIPEDFDLMCFGNSEISKYLKPALSGVDPKADEIGRESINLIIKLIENQNQQESRNVKVKPSLILRETCV